MPVLRRILRWLGYVAGGLLALVVVLVAAVLVLANVAPGRRLIETEVASLTGGTVRIAGLAGRFPDALRIGSVTIADAHGVWLTIDGLRLRWHPLHLASLAIDVDDLDAAAIVAARLPVPTPPAHPARPPAKGGGLRLPFSLRIERIALPAIDLAAPVAGRALALAVEGHAAIADLQPVLSGPSLENFPATDLALDLADRSGRGHYRLEGVVGQGGISLRIAAHEQAGGLVATFAHSDQISPLALELALDGPRSAEALHLNLAAGKLVASADGLVDLTGQAARLAISAHAPAMQPVPGVSWQSVALDADLHGPLRRPAAEGHLRIAGLAAGGATVGRIDGDLSGSQGPVTLHAVLTGLRIPGPKPDLLAASPVTVDATAHLDGADRPVELHLAHPLLDLAARLRTAGATAGAIAGHVDLRAPDLAPLAAAGGVDLAGHATLGIDLSLAGADQSATIAGKVALTGGIPQAVALIGPDGTIALAAERHGADITLRSLAVTGRAVALQAAGTDLAGTLDTRLHLVLPALAAASPTVAGHLTIDATATGPLADLAATVHAAGEVGTGPVKPEPLVVDLTAAHLPKAPNANLTLAGRFDGATADIRATAARDAAGAATVHLAAFDWKSLRGRADLALAAGAKLPTGTLDLAIGRLADFSRLAGQPLAGSVAAKLAETAAGARVDVTAADLAAAGAQVGRLTLAGTIADPAANPDLALRLDATGLARGAIGGNVHATARGRLAALAVTLAADSPNLQGAPATADTTTLVDVPRSMLTLSRLAVAWHGETVRLAAPARIAWAPAVTLGNLRLAVAAGTAPPATITVDGRVAPTLALTATVRDVTPALAAPFAPTLDAQGRIDAEARLGGTPAAPTGTVRVTAAGMRLRTGPAAALPAADLTATATLAGSAARVVAHLAAGQKIDLGVTGTVPIRGAGPLDVAARGRLDLAVANPVLEQGGRHLSGAMRIAATATGTVAHPVLGGSVTLERGDLQDFTQGAHLADIEAALTLAGQTVRIDRFTAKAGSGTLGVAGTVGVLAPGLPVDITVTMNKASPVSSDLLTAVLDADVHVAGQASGRLAVGGRVTIDRADINIPNGLPSSVATLHVIKPGDKPAPVTHGAGGQVIALDLTLAAPGEIFVRGHGIDAVLGGKLHAGGTTAAPDISGGFELRRGTLALAGTTLNFTRGSVGFDGTTNGHLDPTLDFLAESGVQQYTADLAVTGYASKPKITLSSTPALPQDQVLGLLLFGSTTASLSPFQIAQIATALASLSGGGGGFDPIGTVRSKLGLDRLTVGSDSSSNSSTGASIEGGKYVTKRVYVGARESTGGGGTQALVQIDITKRLKAFTTVGTGGTVTGATTPENDPGSNVGLKYQFRY